MVMFIREVIRIIIFKATGYWMAIRDFIRELGRRTCLKVKELTSFRIIPNTKGSFIMDYPMVEASIQTSCFAIKACLMKACFMAKECYFTKLAKPSKGICNEIALKREYTNIQTAIFTVVTSNKTKNQAKANTNQPTVTITKVISKKENVQVMA